MKWAIRDLLNPVVTRSMIFGANPFDIEYILKKIDGIKVMSGKQIQNVWLGEWAEKIRKYTDLARQAAESGHRISAREYYKLAAECHYACFMINTEDIDKKAEIYDGRVQAYRQYIACCDNRVEYVEINTEYGVLPAYLHFPDDGSHGPYPCVMTYSGIGSCKEELEMLADPLTKRGLAVLTPDMPGAGAAVIRNGIKCGGPMLESAFDSIYAFLTERPDIDQDRLANFGLCMGGGYAFRASAKHPETRCCVSLFPLLMNFADQNAIPVWMKRGKWSSFQYADDYLEGMKRIEEGTVACDFLMAYSDDDNWMDTDASMRLYNKATGYKEKIYIAEKPAYVSEETIMHAMPVGEQFHWVKHRAADFLADRLAERK